MMEDIRGQAHIALFEEWDTRMNQCTDNRFSFVPVVMEDSDSYNSGFVAAIGGSVDEDDETQRSGLFAELKPYCLELLELLQNPQKNSSALHQLLCFLRKSPSIALQPFFDYILFPLLLLLDAAVDCRSVKKVDYEEKLIPDVLNMPHKVSDSVAEGVLCCLEELLKKCQLGSVDQMVVVLKKLTSGALLSASEAAEEFREGVIRCFKELILSLQPCSDMSCSCKQSLDFPMLLVSRDLQGHVVKASEYDSEQGECLISFLQSQHASAAVGHWLSLLLKAADTEVQGGHRGSAKLRVEAFLSLRLLVAKVGSADALAFFLPGVVSQFSKVLYVSKTMISGAAGSVEAMDQAIRGLAEFLMVVLRDDANLLGLDNVVNGFHSSMDESTQSFLEELRQLPLKAQGQSETMAEDSSSEIISSDSPKFGFEEKDSINSRKMLGSLHVTRTKDWIEKTSTHVDKFLRTTFPKICVHPSKKVRQGLLVAIQGLLLKCSHTLKKSRLMLLECLCVLVCDDSEDVSAAAQESLEYLFSSSDKHVIEHDVAEIFNRLIENLPKVVLGSDESVAVSHAQQLLVVIYFSGPQFLVDHLLQSPIKAARFLDVFALCLNQNSEFSGSLDRLLLARPSSTGYLQSFSELKSSIRFTIDDQATIGTAPYEISRFPVLKDKDRQCQVEKMEKEYELPHMPPWFVYVGSQKLYKALAGILRLVGLSMMADFRSEGYLSVITDIPLGYFRKLVSEVRKREYNRESWQSWHHRTGSGKLLRQASTSACILNEIIFGISDQSVEDFARMFQKSKIKKEKMKGYDAGVSGEQLYGHDRQFFNESIWRAWQGKCARSHLIDCIGGIIHEYLSSEVWDLPTEQKSSLLQAEAEDGNFLLHFLHDTALLHQVIIDGIGIFNICLGNDFSSSGFLQSSLYLLLENLICPNFQIRRACDAILHVLATTSGYSTVGHLVLANADYVIDSICRQLRHLDLHPHVPNVLGAMLSYIGLAHKILPLLEEPMRAVSVELEILGRHQHPDLTIPFLKAIAEIVKASKKEASSMLIQAESYSVHVKSKMYDVEKKARIDSGKGAKSSYEEDMDMSLEESEEADLYVNDADLHLDEWESILFKLNDAKRYRQTVGSIASSCLTAATPLVASMNQAACLVALDTVEDGITTLAKVEEAYGHEKRTKATIERVIKMCSFYHLQDTLDAAEEGNDENRLLPAMNKIWPFLVVCIRNKNTVTVRRCLDLISKVIHICGGDFFCRRFHTDGIHFWKLLSTSPFQKRPVLKEERKPLQLPYRSAPTSPEDSMAEVSTLKVQAALLNMIANLSQDKRSASALEAVLKKVSGLVVGIACSSVSGLRDAALNALKGLASIDPDLIWLLLADVYYSSRKKHMPSPPTPGLPENSQILPLPSSAKDYLFVQYGGQSYGFDVDFLSVEIVFQKLHSDVFTSQMYI